MMERKSYILIAMLLALVVCAGVFFYQFNNDVPTFILINGTEVVENSSISGVLMDAYGYGVPNQTITFHKPGHDLGTLVDVTTDEEGRFTIENAQYLPDAGEDNYYDNFTFAGNGKYQGCEYGGNVTVIPK